jgi:xanthine dehydrogenase accessory factor
MPKNPVSTTLYSPQNLFLSSLKFDNSCSVVSFVGVVTKNRVYDKCLAMSAEFYCKVAALAAQRKAFALATIVRVEGSSSAKPGSKAIIDEHGKIALGWVGGGCAESTVRNEALKCIEQGKPELITLDMTDELLGVGMPCGGKMDVYIEPVLPEPELLIVGHGRIAEVLATIAHLMNFSVTVNDPGAERAAFPHARLVTEDFDLTETPIDSRTFVVIATLHKQDHRWLQKALESNAAYISLIASRHRSRLVLDYLLATGMPAEKIERVWAPAGLDLGASTPEEIALSIVSQIVALRRGGNVKALKESGPLSKNTATDKVIHQCEGGTR